jgi:DNA-directed RNA polymerase specialized sigma24 family protein
MSETTRLLGQLERGESVASEQLLLLVYDELRRLAARALAREQPGQTLDATALVHEAYLRLVGERPASSPPEFANRRHFFVVAASWALLRRRRRGHAAHPG